MRTDSVKWLWQIAIIKMIVEKAKIISTTTIYKLRRAFFFYFIGFEMKKPKYCTRASGHLNIVTALFVRLFVFSIMCSLSIVMVEKKTWRQIYYESVFYGNCGGFFMIFDQNQQTFLFFFRVLTVENVHRKRPRRYQRFHFSRFHVISHSVPSLSLSLNLFLFFTNKKPIRSYTRSDIHLISRNQIRLWW